MTRFCMTVRLPLRISRLAPILVMTLVWTAPVAAGVDDSLYFEGAEAYDAGRYGETIHLWRAAADACHAAAATALAGLYATGEGVGEPDDHLALRLYTRAARLGDPVAQANLGDIYARGVGVERDAVDALTWLTLAAAAGNAWAGNRADEVRAGMEAARITRAEERAGAFAPQRPGACAALLDDEVR